MKSKAVVIKGCGSIDKILVEERDIREPVGSEVMVKVSYSGINYGDLILRKMKLPGMPVPPVIPGSDFSGEVFKVSHEVKALKPGDKVVAVLPEFGGQSQYITIDEALLLPIPKEVPLDAGSAMTVNYLTALGMLENAGITNGQIQNKNVLVHGGSGGVGSALIQLTTASGFTVYSTASTANQEFLRSLGAIPIDYQKTDFVKVLRDSAKTIDIVFDPIGGTYLTRSRKVMSTNGIYMGYGFQEGLNKGPGGIMLSMAGFYWHKVFRGSKRFENFILVNQSTETFKRQMETITSLYAEGRISPRIFKTFAIDEAAKAHGEFELGKKNGKILIDLG